MFSLIVAAGVAHQYYILWHYYSVDLPARTVLQQPSTPHPHFLLYQFTSNSNKHNNKYNNNINNNIDSIS